MYLVFLTLLHAAACLDIQVEGNVAFDVRVPNGKQGKMKWFRQGWAGHNTHEHEHELVFKMMQVRHNVTAAPEVECIYQYPEKEQVNAVLSNMMNQLTKVFVRTNDFINGVDARRGGGRKEIAAKKEAAVKKKIAAKKEAAAKKKIAKKEAAVKEEVAGKEVQKRAHFVRRGVESRFKIVKKKQKAFFELIYANMSNEYRQFYNTTAERVDRSGRDPCQHQEEVRQMWRDLLEHAHSTLRAAAARCVREHLRDQRVAPRARLRARLDRFLTHELSKVRATQLQMLCDTYQLCYNDLL